jgi:hypothetical protein
MKTTVTRSYDRYSDAKAAVHALREAGCDNGDISLISHKDRDDESDSVADGIATGAGVGAALGGTAGLLTGLGIMAIPGVGPVVAAGWLATTALGALAGAAAGGAVGGLVDALVDSGESREHAEVYAEHVRRGGAIVSVRTKEENRSRVAAILDGHRPIDVARRRSAYAASGWTAFDPKAAAYSVEEARAERARYLDAGPIDVEDRRSAAARRSESI